MPFCKRDQGARVPPRIPSPARSPDSPSPVAPGPPTSRKPPGWRMRWCPAPPAPPWQQPPLKPAQRGRAGGGRVAKPPDSSHPQRLPRLEGPTLGWGRHVGDPPVPSGAGPRPGVPPLSIPGACSCQPSRGACPSETPSPPAWEGEKISPAGGFWPACPTRSWGPSCSSCQVRACSQSTPTREGFARLGGFCPKAFLMQCIAKPEVQKI